MKRIKLKDKLDYIQPTKYIVDSDQYSDEFITPVLTAGDSFILGYTNEKHGIYPASEKNPVILFDDFTTSIQWVAFPFKVKSSACKILVPKTKDNLRYYFYAMRSIVFDHVLHKRYWISEFSEIEINDHDKKDQIVEELDGISNLIIEKKNEISHFDELIKSRFNEQEVSIC